MKYSGWYSRKQTLLFITLASLLTGFLASGANVVINEIMYHSVPEVPEEANREWIEIFNAGTNTVPLEGWRISKGVSFVFPPTDLPPGGYLVIAADVATFQSLHPTVANVVGGWTGGLGNNGEQIQLDNELGQQVDEVNYANQGDWGIRRRGLSDNGTRGWEWYALHDGLGRSLELRNPSLANTEGQNWGTSNVENGTPGLPNTLLTANLAPLILEVRHYPAVPRSSDPVTITTRIEDEQASGISVYLFYRNASSASPPPYSSKPMTDDGTQADGLAGDGIYGAMLPANPSGTVIEYYVQAADAANNTRTWPAPAEVAVDESGPAMQAVNCAYQVDEELYPGSHPVYRIVMTESERLRLQNINRSSNAEINGTLVIVDGEGTQVRHNIGTRIRGQGSRGRTPPNFRVNIPNDRRWDGLAAINLNTQFVHSQLAGSVISQRAGVPVASGRAVQVRVNGTNLALSGEPSRGTSTGSGFGTYILLEPHNGDWAGRHFPNDGNGNVYRGIPETGTWLSTLEYLGENQSSYIGRYSKTSNRSQNDWSDIVSLTRALSSNLPDAEYLDAMHANVNVEMWMRYFALMSLVVYSENGLPNGVGDDYAMYRGVTDPRFVLMPHDQDTILGEGDGSYNDWGIAASIWLPADRSGGNLPWASRFLRHNEFAPIYFKQLKELAGTVMTPAELDGLLNRALGGWVPDYIVTRMKEFAANRVANVLSQIPQTYSATASLPTQSDLLYTTTSSVTFTGTGNAIETRSVTVNGAPATWTAWQGTWTVENINMLPGINRALVQWFNGEGTEIHQASVDVWYDDGNTAPLPASITTDQTLSAAGGPYVAPGNIVVQANVTLTIEPGTTIHFPTGAGMTIYGSLVAEGTEFQRIRFTGPAGTDEPWSGLRFVDAEDNLISHADIEYAYSSGQSIELLNSVVVLDQLTWSGTANTIIEMSNSSLIVRNSVFPTIDNDETIHGTGMPANGFVVIDGNYFGGTTGYSDIIDFTGGRRPGPIIQVLNNVFEGGSDDALDLDGTDAHIEGNVFRDIHKNNTSDSSSNAIATDTDSEITVVRNLFLNLDHAVLLKNGAFLTSQNNTYVNCQFAVVNFDEPNRDVNPGRGALIEGDIFWNNGAEFLNYYYNHPTEGTVDVMVKDSILQTLNWPAAGTWEHALVADPMFVNAQNDFRLRSGPAAGTGPNGLDMGAFVPPGPSISGEPPPSTPLTNATLTIAGPGITHYAWRLNSGPLSAETPIGNPIQLTGLTDGTYTVYVLGKNSAGTWQPVSQPNASRTWTVNTALRGLVINEVLARNTALAFNGQTPDWIELYNGSPRTLDLAGMGITDDLSNPYKYVIPQGTSLEAREHLVFFGDNEAGPGFHLGFALDQNGDAVYLFEAPQTGGVLIDSVQFGLQLADRSIGRNAAGNWVLCQPTLAGINQPQSVGDPFNLKINEWLAEGAGTLQDDFVELWNPNATPVPLGGLYLSDVPGGWPNRHQVAPLSFIEAQNALAFIADGNPGAGAHHLNFRLSPEQGQIALFAPDLSVIDWIVYGPQVAGVSEGRRPNGAGNVVFFGYPTPGGSNPGGAGSTTVTSIVVPLFPLAQTWKYNQYGTNLNTGWREAAYDDSAWNEGAALLANEQDGVYTEPFRTVLDLIPPGGSSQTITYYFRQHFAVTQDLSSFTLQASALVDDGAVFYLNGTEVGRLRMDSDPVLYDTLATANQPAEGQTELLTFPAAALVPGDNVLAVEVHQGAVTSSDVVFGLSLEASRSLTNILGFDVVLNEIMANNSTITQSDGSATDWVELHNPNNVAIELADMSLTDDLSDSRRWIVPAGVTLPPNGYLLIRFDSSKPASLTHEAILNTGFGLNASGDAVWLFDSPTRTGNLLDGVIFGLQAADFSIGRSPNGVGGWALNIATPRSANLAAPLGNASNLRINEWMANEQNGGDDWIELFNPNPQPVALGGLFLTDKLDNRTKHPIAGLSFIGSYTNGYTRFIADNDLSKGAHHVGFRLDADGEAIGLFPSGGAAAIDTVIFGPQANGISEGRFPDGAALMIPFPYSPSPNEGNFLPLVNVVINEALTHTDPPFEDAIELQNVSNDPVNVGGWFLSDDRNELRKFRIPDPTVIPPHEFVVFYENEFNAEPGFPWSFSLDSTDGDQIHLSTGDETFSFTGYRASVKFGAAANGVSFGRYETSIGADFTAMTARSFGVDNPTTLAEFRAGTGSPNPAPLIGPIVISEIQYHPPNLGTNDNVVDEYIELRNISGGAVKLFDANFPTNTWGLKDAVSYSFPPGTEMPAGSHALIVSFDPTNTAALNAFTSLYGVPAGVPIFGPYLGKLDNSSDRVELYQPDAPQIPSAPDAGFVPRVLVDKVEYRDSAPWSRLADGLTNGYSLQRITVTAYGNDPVNWTAGEPTPGAVSGAAVVGPPVITLQPQPQDVYEGSNVTFSVAVDSSTSLTYQWRFNGYLIPDATNATLTLNAVTPIESGRYYVVVSNPGGSAASQTAILSIKSPPVILQPPQTVVVTLGNTARFAVVARGTSPLSYQWMKNGEELPGQTGISLQIPNAQLADEGAYSVRISNVYGTVASSAASLYISIPPTIVTQPVDTTVEEGSLAILSVATVGSPPFQYQWYFAGQPIPGAVDATLNLLNVKTNQTGNYQVTIANAAGSATSREAYLTVVPVPLISVTASTYEINESDSYAEFTITRSFVTNVNLMVHFTLSGNAVIGQDYQIANSPVVIPANAASVKVQIAPVNDNQPEPRKVVLLTVVSGSGYLPGTPNVGAITILDDDNKAPFITITYPEEGDFFLVSPTNLPIRATAFDEDGTISRVEIYQNQTNRLALLVQEPYVTIWTNAFGGNYQLTAVAMDNFGMSSTSAPISILINKPPLLSLTVSGSGGELLAPATITMRGFSMDSDGVAKVEFYVNGSLLTTTTQFPYLYTWTPVPVGAYVIMARAYDKLGAVSVASTTVTVVPFRFELNDMFASRNTAVGSPLSIEGSNVNATWDDGEPRIRRMSEDSVWLGWRASYDSRVTIDTFGSDFNTVMSVYTGNALSSLTRIADNDNYNSQQSLVNFATQAGTVYNIQITSRSFSNPGNIRLNLVEDTPAPYLTSQPQSQTVARGETAAFSASAMGNDPLSYQWRLNGAELPGAINDTLVIANAQVLQHAGTYSVRITNAFGSAISSGALLTVDDGLYSTQRVDLVSLDQTWRYEASGTDLGTAWREFGFDDSGWPIGTNLFGYENEGTYPYPILTPVNPPQLGGPNTVYFRARFNLADFGDQITLIASNWVDDGAIYYLNGTEVGRVRLEDELVNFYTYAVSPNNEGQTEVMEIPAAALRTGANVLAVEVHQSSSTSSDIVFGMALEASIAQTSRPMLSQTGMLLNGHFQLTLDGIDGRVYAVDVSTNLLNWTPWMSFTNTAPQTLIIDESEVNGEPRFYRGRLVR